MPALVTGSLQATVSLLHTTQQLPGMGIGTAAPVGGGAWRKRVGRFAVWGAETLGRSLFRHQTLRGWPNNKP